MTSHMRLGRRGLAAIRASLSERDLAVLGSVAEHRFLTSRQIEGLHFAEHATPSSGARACRRVLLRLHADRILSHLSRRIGGVRAGSASFVWALGPVGDRLLREQAGEGVRHRFHEPSTTFLDHCLAVGDIHLRLRIAERAGVIELPTVRIEPDCWRGYLGASGEQQILKPDLYAVTAAGEYEDCWFIEVDRATESLAVVVRKCAQYETYRRTGIEQHKTGVFPLVVWVVPHAQRQTKIRQALTETHGLDTDLYRVVLPEELPALVAGGAA